MVLLFEAVEAKKLDVRTIERNITRGVLTESESRESAKGLPDDQENASWVSLESLAQEDQNES